LRPNYGWRFSLAAANDRRLEHDATGMACIGFQDRCEYAAVSASKRSRAN
jgi:hypothetical protein